MTTKPNRLMKVPQFVAHVAILVAMSAISFTVLPSQSTAAGKTSTKANTKKKVVGKLPAKASKKKRTFLDFTKSETNEAVVFKSLSPLNQALIKSDQDLEASTRVTEVRSRTIIPAPQGDLAEPLSALSVKRFVAPAAPSRVATKVKPATKPPWKPAAVAAIKETPKSPPAAPKIESTQTSSVALSTEAIFLGPETLPTVTDASPAVSSGQTATLEPMPTAKTSSAVQSAAAKDPSSRAARSIFSFRTGYLSAGYRKFDDRMSDGATSIGLSSAREFETSFGAIEGRAAIDVFHATDQSISVANTRMVSVRAEATRWLTNSRVKPGLSLGLGWADSSIRSYRSRSDQNDSPSDITVRTHAEGQSVSVIPSAALRIGISESLNVDVQAEYLALFGSDASEASRGMAVTVSLGWMNF